MKIKKRKSIFSFWSLYSLPIRLGREIKIASVVTFFFVNIYMVSSRLHIYTTRTFMIQLSDTCDDRFYQPLSHGMVVIFGFVAQSQGNDYVVVPVAQICSLCNRLVVACDVYL